jgi:hypothetical protein
MEQQETTFTLEGADGEKHTYDVALHPGLEGSQIALRLYTMAGEPLGELVQTFAQSDDLDGEDDAGELLSEVDMSSVVSNIRDAIMSLDSEAFLLEVLKYTDRDGQPLKKEINFDEAYRGNYGELWQAVWKVIEANGFLTSVAGFLK